LPAARKKSPIVIMIDAKPRGILGDDRVARAPAQHRVVAVAQPGEISFD
jgi:hypothetical protein